MNRIRSSARGWAAFGLVAAGASLAQPVHAQTTADLAFSAWNSAFLVQQSGQAYYAPTLHGTAVEGSWVQALDIEVAEDAYLRTRTPANQQLVSDLLTHFLAYENYDWSLDTWNDDIAWMTLACVRAYQITGNTTFLNKATYAWNMAYNRGWDTTYGGGGIWENMDNFVHSNGYADKCALSTDPFITSGLALYQITGDSSYLTKSQAIYAWVRGTIFNTSTGVVNEGEKWTIGQTNSGFIENSDNVYNSGSFLQAANYLYRLTGNAQYYNDAVLAANHVVNSTPILNNNGGSQTQWEYRFVKGLSEFATDNNLWPQYQTWMQNNANAAWSKRDSNNLTWNNWLTTTNDPNIDPMESSSAVGVWQVLPNPNLSVSGSYEIVNVASNMALGISGNSTSQSAAIVQSPYTGASGQKWTFTLTSGGYCQLKNVNSGMVMNVSAASVQAGASVFQWPAQNMNPGNDQWLPIVNADGTYSFFNHDSIQALDDAGASTASGNAYDQYWPNNTNAQKFSVVPLGTIANGTYTLTPACATGSRLDGNGLTSGTNMTIWGATGGANQRWTFTANAVGNGYKITPATATGLSLDVSGAGTANGTTVDIWTSNTTNAQKWGLTSVSGGYTLTPFCATGTRLDVAAANPANGTKVDIYQANGSNAQTWAINPG